MFSVLRWFLSNFEFHCRYCENEDPKLFELTLLNLIKKEAFYIFYFQIYKFIVSWHFDFMEYGRGLEGIPT